MTEDRFNFVSVNLSFNIGLYRCYFLSGVTQGTLSDIYVFGFYDSIHIRRVS